MFRVFPDYIEYVLSLVFCLASAFSILATASKLTFDCYSQSLFVKKFVDFADKNLPLATFYLAICGEPTPLHRKSKFKKQNPAQKRIYLIGKCSKKVLFLMIFCLFSSSCSSYFQAEKCKSYASFYKENTPIEDVSFFVLAKTDEDQTVTLNIMVEEEDIKLILRQAIEEYQADISSLKETHLDLEEDTGHFYFRVVTIKDEHYFIEASRCQKKEKLTEGLFD